MAFWAAAVPALTSLGSALGQGGGGGVSQSVESSNTTLVDVKSNLRPAPVTVSLGGGLAFGPALDAAAGSAVGTPVAFRAPGGTGNLPRAFFETPSFLPSLSPLQWGLLGIVGAGGVILLLR